MLFGYPISKNRGATNYFFPVVLSVGMHVALLVLVAWGWKAAPMERKTAAPRFIEAKIVELKATSPKVAPPKKQPKKIDVAVQQAEKERVKREQEAKLKETQANQLKAKKEQEKKDALKKEQAEKVKKEKEKKDQELAQQKRLEDQLSESLSEEEDLLMAEENEVTAQSYLALITGRIKQNWSRPPSARNGMKCRLLIELVPTGRVVNVTITESSGNSAFDRSAEQAVWKVEQFTELQKVESVVFEQYFRRLPVLFEPQDLRL